MQTLPQLCVQRTQDHTHHHNLSVRLAPFPYALQEVSQWEANALHGELFWGGDVYLDLAGIYSPLVYTQSNLSQLLESKNSEESDLCHA